MQNHGGNYTRPLIENNQDFQLHSDSNPALGAPNNQPRPPTQFK